MRDLVTRDASAEMLPLVEAHLSGCAPCRLYVERMREVRRLAKEHHARLEPDEGFHARLAARMTRPSGVTLAWATLRVLPATLVLLGILSLLAWLSMGESTGLAQEAPTDNLPSWFLEQSETGT